MSRSSTTKRSNTTEPSTFGKSFSVQCGEVLQDGYKLLPQGLGLAWKGAEEGVAGEEMEPGLGQPGPEMEDKRKKDAVDILHWTDLGLLLGQPLVEGGGLRG